MVKKIILILLAIFNFSFGMSFEDIKKAYHLSYQYEKMQDYKDAIKVLIPIYNKYPTGYTVNLRLGWLYYLNKNYANSKFHYEKAIKALPYSIEAKLGYTLPLLAQGKFSDVEKVCYSIISKDYYNYYANLRLSYVLRKEKKFEDAQKIVNKMLLVYPTDVKFLTELALIKYALKDYKTAKKIFQDIIILDPENILAKNYLYKIKEREK